MIARLASAGTRRGNDPREMIHYVGRELTLRVLQIDPLIPSHNLCAMWWNSRSADECSYLANLARGLR